MRDQHQTIEERYEAKVSRTVLKTNGVGNNLVEFNNLSHPSKRLDSLRQIEEREVD